MTAHAFGPFVDAQLDLAPGLNVVAGPNEAGKSSWQAAIYAGLCGMRRGPGLRGEDREFANRHRPWTGDAWEVGCVVELPDGRRLELRSDLAGRVDCTARDLALGTDVSAEILHDGAPDGARWLNLDRRTFVSVACVRQAEILAVVQRADDLQEQLQRAAATAGADSTAANALGAIEDFKREQVGLRRVNSSRPLQRAIEELRHAEAWLAAAREEHDEWRALEQKAAELETRARRADLSTRRFEAAVAKRNADALGERFAEAHSLAERYPQDPEPGPGDDELADRVLTAVRDWGQRPQPQPPAGPTTTELGAELAILPPAPTGDLEPHVSVIEAERIWHGATTRLEAHRQRRPGLPAPVDTGGATAAEVDDLARVIAQPIPEPDPELEAEVEQLRAEAAQPTARPRPKQLLLAAGSIVGVVGATVAITGPVVAGIAMMVVGVAIAAAASGLFTRSFAPSSDDGQLRAAETRIIVARQNAESAQHQRDAALGRVHELGLPADAGQLRHIADTRRELDRAAGDAQQWTNEHDGLITAMGSATDALVDALAERGATFDHEPGDGDGETALRRYRTQCTDRREAAALAARRPDLERALANRLELDERYDQDCGRLSECERSLRTVAAEALGPDAAAASADADRLVAELRAWQEGREQRRTERQELVAGRARLAALLDGRPLDQLLAAADRAMRLSDELMADLAATEDGEHELPTELGPDPERAARERRESTRAYEVDASQARSERDARACQLVPVAEATERLAAAHEELARVERLEATLDLAIRFLTAAEERVHRDIAPLLGNKVSDRLSHVTGGRYREVLVNPRDLGVQVREPNGNWRAAAQLSHGTAEQVYLLLRIAMAEILTPAGTSCPLLLDDVTVQSDSARNKAVLEVLQEASKTHQIVLFTQEAEVTAWAEQYLGDRDRLIELPPATTSSS